MALEMGGGGTVIVIVTPTTEYGSLSFKVSSWGLSRSCVTVTIGNWAYVNYFLVPMCDMFWMNKNQYLMKFGL